MTAELHPSVWNAMVTKVLEALWGEVSMNFRMVSLHHPASGWHLRFVLADASARDREGIEIIRSRLVELLGGGDISVVVEVVSPDVFLPAPPGCGPVRLVYMRREPT